MALTEIAIKALKPGSKEQKIYDSGGLYLAVTPNGAKIWRLKYRVPGAEKLTEKKLTLGVYPTLTLKEARFKRDEARKQISEGIDPAAEKKTKKRLAVFNAANTFQAIAVEWHELNKSKWTQRHGEVLLRRLDLHVFPSIGNRPIKDIRPIEILEMLRKVEKRGATHQAHRLLQVCKLIFRYAIVTERVEYNAAADLNGALKPHREKHHPTLKAKELPRFLQSIETVETTEQNRLALKLLLLTFMRQGELRHSKWQDIHWKAKEWHIPAENTKMRDEHVVPLADPAITLLKELQQITGWSEYLFPTQQRQKNAVMSENTINVIIKRMGYEGQIVGHGFRALASTILNEQGFRADVIERQLAHKERNKVRAAYNRAEYMPERHKMMQWWAEYLTDAMHVPKEDRDVRNRKRSVLATA